MTIEDLRAELAPLRAELNSIRALLRLDLRLVRAAKTAVDESDVLHRVQQDAAALTRRAKTFRQRANEAKQEAAETKDASIKIAFEHEEAFWLMLAEQMEWQIRLQQFRQRNAKP